MTACSSPKKVSVESARAWKLILPKLRVRLNEVRRVRLLARFRLSWICCWKARSLYCRTWSVARSFQGSICCAL